MSRYRLRFATSVGSSVQLQVKWQGRTVATYKRRTGRGANVIRFPGDRAGVHTLVLRARSRTGTVDEDRVGLVFGERLSVGLARRLIEGDVRFSEARAADAASEYVDRCRRGGPFRRRIPPRSESWALPLL